MGAQLEKCEPLRVEFRNHPSRRALISMIRKMAGIRRPRYYYHRDGEGRVYVYIVDLENPRRRVRLAIRPVRHVHEDNYLIDHYWSLIYAYICIREDDEVAG